MHSQCDAGQQEQGSGEQASFQRKEPIEFIQPSAVIIQSYSYRKDAGEKIKSDHLEAYNYHYGRIYHGVYVEIHQPYLHGSEEKKTGDQHSQDHSRQSGI